MNAPENKICQNCKNQFVIEPEDFTYYQKARVPPPTFCPDCRLQRRMTWRNERALYKDQCDLCGNAIVSMYSPEKPFKVYCKECWFSDKWDAAQFAQEYDWQKPFFLQYRALLERVPRMNLFWQRTNVNVDYANFIVDSKNIYLTYSAVGSENIYYSRSMDKSRECFDCFNGNSMEMCYENVDAAKNFRTKFMVRSHSCISSAFLFDCANCQDCFMSANLRNKRYVLRNRQYSRDEYEKAMDEIDVGKYSAVETMKKEYRALMAASLHKFANLIKTTNCTGDNIQDSKNVKRSFDVYGGEDSKFCVRILAGAKDNYDIIGGGAELLYDGIASGLGTTYGARFYTYNDAVRDVYYTDWCLNGSNLFGCIGLRKKDYCILNKQYSKEEYQALMPKVITHMDDVPYVNENGVVYKFGEFHPAELSPWSYNETVAQEYFPLKKEEALKIGYSWRDPDPYPHKPTKQVSELPDSVRDVADSIINDVIACPDCGRAYRIIRAELEFLCQQNIPLPRKCPDCRYRERFRLRNPLKLWHRQCACDYAVHHNSARHTHHSEGRCPNEFETSYAPERSEVVYCEQCYNAEVV